MSTTPGWLMVAMVRASPRNRSAKPGSSSSAGSRIFPATVRPSPSSVARHTSPMPPPAIRSSRRYRPPSIVPGLNIVHTSFRAPFRDGGLHDLPTDAGRLQAAAPASVGEEDGDRDERLAILHGEPDEPAVLAHLVAGLGGAGLTADVEPADLRLRGRAALDDTHHHLLQAGGDLAADRLGEFVRRGGEVDGGAVGA